MTRARAEQTRIARRFAELTARGEGALVPFIVAGDPDLQTTLRVMQALARAGADVIELGIPFSDPLADGPVNQAAYDRALRAGATVEGVLDLVGRFRARHVGAASRSRPDTAGGGCATSQCGFETPVVLMTYSNPVAQFGWQRFAEAAAQAGVDGVLLTDLPPEEAEAWLRHARAEGLDTIFLLAPTSPDERIASVAELATGYIYCVSRLGVTGARDQLPPDARALVERVRVVGAHGGAPELPVVVGFGLSRPEQIRAVCEFADGAVVGSALVELIARHAGAEDLEQVVEEFTAALKAATAPGAS
ncbi:MAG TPA: tryptophan synthase subunit alpha [Armatimonadota bacterium]|nr:tryptophan synthase subunit alpha [Armatimonadota bacterium]